MTKNRYIPDFGDLNHFFDEYITPQDFMNELTDIIDEYARLALIKNEEVVPNETALRISILNGLHRELRKAVK